MALSKGRRSKFNQDTLSQEDDNGDRIGLWCRPGDKEEDAFCIVCSTTIHCLHHGAAAVKRHSQNKKHIELCKALRGPDGTLKRPPTVQAVLDFTGARNIMSHADTVTASEARFALAITLRQLPYSWADTATPLYHAMFPDSRIAQDFSCSRKKTSYIVSDGLGPYFEGLVSKELNQSAVFYSIVVDETPLPELRCQQLDVLVRYFSDVHKEVVVEHLRSFRLGSATSNILFKCVNEALVNIPRAGFFSFFSDGPNVMKSLKKKLADDNLSLIDVGECWLHKVHNAFSHALDSFAAEVESAVVDTYYFFKHSSVQSSHLKEQQNILGLPEAVFLRHVSSRWLSLMPALERLLEQLPALMSVLAAEAPVRSSGSIKERLRKTINNKEFCAKALFVKNASEIFTKFLTLFQKSEPLIHILYSECVTLVKKVLGRFLRLNVFQNMSGQQLATLDVESSENWQANVELGADTEAAMVSWSANEKAAFRLGARTFYMKCARYLLKQLPLKNSVLMHLSCLEPSASVSESSRESFRELAKYAPQVIPSSDVSSLLDEVTEFCLEPLPATVDGPLDSYWQNVFERKNAENQAKYPLLTKLVKALLSLPHGNADVERGFSQNNRVLHDRSSLSLESINGIRRTLSFARRYDGDPCKFEIGRDVVKAVRNASKRYSERLAQEKQALKRLRTDAEQSTPNKSEADAQNEAVDAERMLKNAELLIERGMKQKNFGDIQSGQALLMKAREKMAASMKQLESMNKAKKKRA